MGLKLVSRWQGILCKCSTMLLPRLGPADAGSGCTILVPAAIQLVGGEGIENAPFLWSWRDTCFPGRTLGRGIRAGTTPMLWGEDKLCSSGICLAWKPALGCPPQGVGVSGIALMVWSVVEPLASPVFHRLQYVIACKTNLGAKAELPECTKGGDKVLTTCNTGVLCLCPASASQAGMYHEVQDVGATAEL